MWWREYRRHRHFLAAFSRLAIVFGVAGLSGGCFEPLYGNHGSVQSEGIYAKLNAVEIAPIDTPKGTPAQRVAVGLRNALQFDLNGGAGANAPTHRLVVNVGASQFTVVVNPQSGLPDAEVAGVAATYRLVEIATGKTVLSDSTFSHVDYDIPGPQQFFVQQRARRNAEDRALKVVAETIRNRLASYFVAGT